ncbi:MAG: tRNA (adenosine(37)-N6)-dimethylallyltransferase MiaA [Methylocystis sp.]|nr:tRNA (adenosine(37)-N6)-dimethylallyltransferase MiaA [Methylocystis sp.]MCA3585875.1 tRNA (adenosine(37)-N6)-dimethylallyltransferase MiaA [Methylocystis sp.]MCA3586615.1 tRNA (adenosine(37)-N6)-dimethylallyltransferase MiaA [Methylocystis sp.]MCA3590893.1 tRNA (adenosine(37)-N6)-dimethylallyltransferase MiaA [Methylocystis sp.]
MDNALLNQIVKDAEGRDALLIAGPTASGKSALAMAAAQATGGVVVNADSMQIYGGIRILTARPTPEEEAAVEHRLYGFVDPAIAFSTGDYVRAVKPVLAELRARGRLAVIVGGTGLYFKALTDGLVAMPEIPPAIMAEVVAMEAAGQSLHAWLTREDPDAAARLSPADRPRLQRAVSVKLATGRTLGDWQRDATVPLLSAGAWAGVILTPDRQRLYGRIDRRFLAMMDQGALDEARQMRQLALPANRGIMKAHGMPHLIRHLDGQMTLADAISLGQQDTRNYSRRQGVWARRFMTEWRQAGPELLS